MRKIRTVYLFIIICSIIFLESNNYAQISPDIQRQISTAPGSTRIGMIKAVFEENTGMVKLTWTKIPNPVSFKYRIYRDVNILDQPTKLRESAFISEVDGNIDSYLDRIETSGKYYYAVSIVDIDNKETKELALDQSYTGRPVSVLLTPENVTNISVDYELGTTRVLLRWKNPESRELAKIRIYRDKNKFTAIKAELKIAEFSSNMNNYYDTIQEPGRYYYAITTVSVLGKENQKLIPQKNVIEESINVKFYASRITGIEGFDYETQIVIDRSHPPIFFRFIQELLRERETFSQFDIYDVKPFKEVSSTLIPLPALPPETRSDRNIESLTPLPQRSEQQSRLEDEALARERRLREEAEQRRRQAEAEQIFLEDERAALIERQNQQRQQGETATAAQQRIVEQQTTRVETRNPADRREEITPVPSTGMEQTQQSHQQTQQGQQQQTGESQSNQTQQSGTGQQAQQSQQATERTQAQISEDKQRKFAAEVNELKTIINELFYTKKDYKTSLIKLRELYRSSNNKPIKERALFFYGKSLYELKDFERAMKIFSSLTGTEFYQKYKNEVDLMIKRCIERN